MKTIVRRFEGEDLVIVAAELARLGVRVGQYVAIRGMQPLPLAIPLTEGEKAASRVHQDTLATAWARTTLAEEVNAECEHEELWERWSSGD